MNCRLNGLADLISRGFERMDKNRRFGARPGASIVTPRCGRRAGVGAHKMDQWEGRFDQALAAKNREIAGLVPFDQLREAWPRHDRGRAVSRVPAPAQDYRAHSGRRGITHGSARLACRGITSKARAGAATSGERPHDEVSTGGMTVFLYVRVSTQDQNIDMRLTEGRGVCHAHGVGDCRVS